jgi:single-strand DNA-binding protein
MNNSITILGHVGKEPKQVTLINSSKELVTFSVAVKELSSNGQNKTLWLDVEAWNNFAERALSLITRGREVMITGRLAINSYTAKDGTKVSKPVIRMTGFQLCGKKPEQASIETE